MVGHDVLPINLFFGMQVAAMSITEKCNVHAKGEQERNLTQSTEQSIWRVAWYGYLHVGGLAMGLFGYRTSSNRACTATRSCKPTTFYLL